MSGPPLTVAFLGTGVMGAPMARNIAGAGLNVRVWNRTTERARPLEAAGATVGEEPAHAVDGADVVVTMLSDVGPTLEVAEAVLAATAPDAIWAQMGTIGIEGTERCIDLAQQPRARVRRRARSSARSSPPRTAS